MVAGHHQHRIETQTPWGIKKLHHPAAYSVADTAADNQPPPTRDLKTPQPLINTRGNSAHEG
ncbi:hypothetical protein A4G29_18725 [Mycobacterium kansasii]|nr:hypothetical protein A4G29_18725 [Mycobacterium kansasii]